jgi:hypothetical protein
VRIFRYKRGLVMGAVALFLLLFLLRPGASRLKARITNSISLAVARKVEIGTVHIRILPQPGFDLEDLVVYDDPSFGPEPMLRAQEVTAVLRLTTLLRGRMEIARLDLTEPSLNLVRRADGHWNLESLLERTSSIPLAPTAKAQSLKRPEFPYIEASAARINFKSRQEKKPYALTNADFALWQDSDNAWGMRLRAQPLRTDLNLSDTGLLRASGVWQRAGSVGETPLQFAVEWDRAQLGQLTKFLTGNDKGWRGTVALAATLTGTPADLRLTSDASVQDFRRYDISSGPPLLLAMHCDTRYDWSDRTFRDIVCRSPVGEGEVAVRGNLGLPGSRKYNLAFSAHALPVSAVAELARRSKKDLPEDLIALGTVDGAFRLIEDGAAAKGAKLDESELENSPSASPRVEGRGAITGLRLTSAANKVDLAPGEIPLLLTDGKDGARHRSGSRTSGPAQSLSPAAVQIAAEPHFEFGPIPLALGLPAPMTVRVWAGNSGYSISLGGEADIQRLLRLGRVLGLPAVRSASQGEARLDLEIARGPAFSASGARAGFAPPQVTGTAQLRNLRAEVRGLNSPVEIASADLRLSAGEVRVEKLRATAARAQWTGSVVLPRGCGIPGACLAHFDLKADATGLSALSEWLSPRASQHPWYQMLTADAQAVPTFLGSLRATGSVSVARFELHGITASQVSAKLDMDRGKVRVSQLRGEFLGGTHRGEWLADFTAHPPAYTGSGSIEDASLKQLAAAMHDPWIQGLASATYHATTSGLTSAELWQSAEGALQFTVEEGQLSHLTLTSETGPLQMAKFTGRLRLHDGQFKIDDGILDSSEGIFQLSGNASFTRELDFNLALGSGARQSHQDSHGFNITGTLSEPRVEQATVPDTQARLKP